jgi:hypothetical protein
MDRLAVAVLLFPPLVVPSNPARLISFWGTLSCICCIPWSQGRGRFLASSGRWQPCFRGRQPARPARAAQAPSGRRAGAERAPSGGRAGASFPPWRSRRGAGGRGATLRSAVSRRLRPTASRRGRLVENGSDVLGLAGSSPLSPKAGWLGRLGAASAAPKVPGARGSRWSEKGRGGEGAESEKSTKGRLWPTCWLTCGVRSVRVSVAAAVAEAAWPGGCC